MSHKQLQQIRGNATSLSQYIPLQGEVIVNVSDGTIHIGDGAEIGGKWIFEPIPGRSYIGRAIIDTVPPPNPYPGILWFDSFGGQLYLWYEDIDSAAWVCVTNQPGPPGPPGTGSGGGGGGTITAVIPGTGLSGGGTTGNITISLIAPVTIANGGTGAINAVAALANLGGLPLAGGILTGALGINPGRPHAPIGYPVLFLVSNDGPEGVVGLLDSYANSANGSPQFLTRFSRGNAATPTPVLANDLLGLFGATGRLGSGYSGVVAGMQVRALESWSDTAAGAAVEFTTTTPGTLNPILRAQINRGLVLMTAVGQMPTGGDMGAGTVNIPGAFYVNGVAVTGGGTGSGTVTSIIAGLGLTGGTITNAGTIALSVPVAIVNGGTGAISAVAALASLGALPLAGGTMTGLLTLSGAPVTGLHAASKLYVDNAIAPLAQSSALASYLLLSGGVMSGLLTLSGSPTSNLHAATKLYVDNAIAGISGGPGTGFLPLSGGTLTGPLTLPDITTDALHAATKKYVDLAIAGIAGGSFLPLSGGTLSGSLYLSGGNKIGVGTNSPRTAAAVDVIGNLVATSKIVAQGIGGVGSISLVTGDPGFSGFVEWRAQDVNVAGGTRMAFMGYDSGADTLTLNLNAADFFIAGGGLVVGAPTGGALGIGKINAIEVRANNVALTSSLDFKQNVMPLPDCLPLVMAIQPKSFEWLPLMVRREQPFGFPERLNRGFIAQEVAAVLGGDSDSVDLGGLVAVLWKAFQELTDRVAALEA